MTLFVTDCLKACECSSTSGLAHLRGQEALMFESVCNRLKWAVEYRPYQMRLSVM